MIFGAYGEDLSNSFADDVKTNNKGGGGSGGGGIPKTEDKLKEEIKQAERAAKEKWVLQRAIEDAAYSRGEISYQEHVARLQQAEQQYLADCKAAYGQRNMTEEDGYFQLLEKERQLLDKNNKELLNLSLEDLERQQQAERSQVLSDCYNTNSVLFGNEKVRNQRLFEINIDYLRRKAELYRKAASMQLALLQLNIIASHSQPLKTFEETTGLHRELANDFRQTHKRMESMTQNYLLFPH